MMKKNNEEKRESVIVKTSIIDFSKYFTGDF